MSSAISSTCSVSKSLYPSGLPYLAATIAVAGEELCKRVAQWVASRHFGRQ